MKQITTIVATLFFCCPLFGQGIFSVHLDKMEALIKKSDFSLSKPLSFDKHNCILYVEDTQIPLTNISSVRYTEANFEAFGDHQHRADIYCNGDPCIFYSQLPVEHSRYDILSFGFKTRHDAIELVNSINDFIDAVKAQGFCKKN